jgi:hypothetical protein
MSRITARLVALVALVALAMPSIAACADVAPVDHGRSWWAVHVAAPTGIHHAEAPPAFGVALAGSMPWRLHAAAGLPRRRGPTGHPHGEVGARYAHGPWEARLTLHTSSDEARANVAGRGVRARFELAVVRAF